ncbi:MULTISPECIES: adenylate/guanylate cyclase domain-containing protein [unclassified Sulfitobacter]|uniref:adenylate/guanylate cyclase domain-containing protein n=2 Tax=unclassified Sulfitobacter TaxID=196795 RepID=UPI0023E2F099|nr:MULTISPECIES: adenylate/guanylate cyclase domain-containing protein [unclassified Sulfitobacter]
MTGQMLDSFEMATALADLSTWLVQQGLENTPTDYWLAEFCEKVNAAGIPLSRVNLSTRAHHPEIGAVAFRWQRDGASEQFQYSRSNSPTSDLMEEYRRSPLFHLVSNPISEMRQRLDVPDPALNFPIFDELRALGATEYYAAKRYFLRRNQGHVTDPNGPAEEGMTISMVTDQPGGFSNAQLDLLRPLLVPMCLTLKCGANRLMAEDITAAYMGRDASRRVLSGDIMRGSSETISAVILYFDLKGFTKLSESLPGTEVIELLNEYFAEAVDVVEKNGGNVLKFMGDGMLAIFDLTEIPRARHVAIKAAVELREVFAATNERRAAAGQYTTGFSLALHAGDVLYGNIGGKTRLDFTVIGPAVNATARILGMSGPLDQNIVISSQVAGEVCTSRADLVSLGQYRLRGVTERLELFTLD